MRQGLVAVFAAVSLASCGVLPPPSRPLPTVSLPEGCPGVSADGKLTGSPSDPRLAWMTGPGGAGRQDLVWPPHFTARFDPDLEILDATGRIVLREGDTIDGGCLEGPFLLVGANL